MRTGVLFVLLVGVAVSAWGGIPGNAVEVQIRSEGGRMLPLYPVAARSPNRKVYVEAVKGDHYSIIVRNLLNRRVGVVVAVDGRNIISGRQSWLRNEERMYILDPYGAGEFKGWRTSLESINRFYFTDAADSYAAAFHDESAMGVIAVAVYPEVERRRDADLSQAVPKSEQRAAPSAKPEGESAGTGFGREEHSPARLVAFEPEPAAAQKVFIKYEWRSTLCRQGIISCGKTRPPRNRLWDDGEFAPPPPVRSGTEPSGGFAIDP
jgi:hypothetical protein